MKPKVISVGVHPHFLEASNGWYHLVGSLDAKWVVFTSYRASQVCVRGKALGKLYQASRPIE